MRLMCPQPNTGQIIRRIVLSVKANLDRPICKASSEKLRPEHERMRHAPAASIWHMEKVRVNRDTDRKSMRSVSEQLMGRKVCIPVELYAARKQNPPILSGAMKPRTDSPLVRMHRFRSCASAKRSQPCNTRPPISTIGFCDRATHSMACCARPHSYSVNSRKPSNRSSIQTEHYQNVGFGLNPGVVSAAPRDLSSNRRESTAHKNLRTVADTGNAPVRRCCQENTPFELGRNGSGSPKNTVSNYLFDKDSTT